MCGIAGHFGRPRGTGRARAHARARCVRRGPDAQHDAAFDASGRAAAPTMRRAAAGLVHTRLSIIDPRPVADQPMRNDDGTLWICYNGEVYGWQRRRARARGRRRSLRHVVRHRVHPARLRGVGHRGRCCRACAACSRSRSSTSARKRVHVVRDRLGLKPIVYAHDDDGFAFGSTRAQRAAVAARATSAAFRPRRSTPTSRIATSPRRARSSRTSRACPTRIGSSTSSTPDALRDASLVVAAAGARRRLRARCSTRRSSCASSPIVRWACSCRAASTPGRSRAASPQPGIGTCARSRRRFPGRALDESDEAAATAARAGLAERTDRRADDDSRRLRGDRRATLDEPFADPSSFPTWYLARDTERHVKVVLGGDGGDELFAGYKRVAKHLRNAWRGTWRLPLPVLPDVAPEGLAQGDGRARRRLGVRIRAALLGAHAQPAALPAAAARAVPAHYWRAPDLDAATRSDRLMRWDFANYLPEYVLRKADLATMAHGLELRAPLLDHRFVEAVLALPAQRALHASRRSCSSRASRPSSRELGAFARKKRGFNPPLDGWLKDDLRDRLRRGGGLARAARPPDRSTARARAAMIDAYASTAVARRAGPLARRSSTRACASSRRSRAMAGSRAPMRYRERRAGARALGPSPAQARASPRRILVLHHLLLGDTLMLTALLAKLRAQYPAAEIAMTVAPAYRAAVRGPAVRRRRASRSIRATSRRSARC